MSHSTQANNDLQRVESSSAARIYTLAASCSSAVLSRGESNANHRHYRTVSRFALIFRWNARFLRRRSFLFLSPMSRGSIKANLESRFPAAAEVREHMFEIYSRFSAVRRRERKHIFRMCPGGFFFLLAETAGISRFSQLALPPFRD